MLDGTAQPGAERGRSGCSVQFPYGLERNLEVVKLETAGVVRFRPVLVCQDKLCHVKAGRRLSRRELRPLLSHSPMSRSYSALFSGEPYSPR
jgi:hypothetical protein